MADSVLDSLVQEVEDALAENLPAYGVQDILDSIETEFLRILSQLPPAKAAACKK